MELNEIIFLIYPELKTIPVSPLSGYPYTLRNNSDGKGTFIEKWSYEKPQPTKEQLDAITYET